MPLYLISAAYIITLLANLVIYYLLVKIKSSTRYIYSYIIIYSAAFWIIALSLRTVSFGTDSQTYSNIFISYCAGSGLSQLDTSFKMTMMYLELLSLFDCGAMNFPAIWVAAILAPIIISPLNYKDKITCVALILVGFAGLEMTTNAMRQGISVSWGIFCIAAFMRQKKILAFFSAAISIAFHPSSALSLLIFTAATRSWRATIVCALGIGSMMYASLNYSINMWPFSLFAAEVNKYYMVDSDEVLIRVLCVAICIAHISSIAMAYLTSSKDRDRSDIAEYFMISARCFTTSGLFLFIPYFGYRLMYATIIFAVFYQVIVLRGTSLARVSILTLLSSSLIVFLWSIFSSSIRGVYFWP